MTVEYHPAEQFELNATGASDSHAVHGLIDNFSTFCVTEYTKVLSSNTDVSGGPQVEEYTEMRAYDVCGPPKVVLEVYYDLPASPRHEPVYSTVFHHGITTTNPVNVVSLVEHVARYHSNNKDFQEEYKVSRYLTDTARVPPSLCPPHCNTSSSA